MGAARDVRVRRAGAGAARNVRVRRAACGVRGVARGVRAKHVND